MGTHCDKECNNEACVVIPVNISFLLVCASTVPQTPVISFSNITRRPTPVFHADTRVCSPLRRDIMLPKRGHAASLAVGEGGV